MLVYYREKYRGAKEVGDKGDELGENLQSLKDVGDASEGLEDNDEGLEELVEVLDEELKGELEDAGDTWGAAPAPASAQAQIEHSPEEDSFKT